MLHDSLEGLDETVALIKGLHTLYRQFAEWGIAYCDVSPAPWSVTVIDPETVTEHRATGQTLTSAIAQAMEGVQAMRTARAESQETR